MSKRLLKKKLFTTNDWKESSRIERFYIHLQEPERFPLTDSDYKYFKIIKKAFHIMSNEASQMRASNMISELISEVQSDARVHRVMNDVKELFGSMIKRNKSFERMVIQEKLTNVAERAKETGELDIERLCYVNIYKLLGLDRHEAAEFNPEDFQLPELEFTSNPEALRNTDSLDAEIVENEETNLLE